MSHKRTPDGRTRIARPGATSRSARSPSGPASRSGRSGSTRRRASSSRPSRLEGGFRLYSEDDVRRVEQIKRLQSLLGISLADIKDMVEAEEVKLQIRATYRKDADVSERRGKIVKVKEVTEGQVGLVDQKIAALQEMKGHLQEKLTQYETWLEQLDEQARAQPVG